MRGTMYTNTLVHLIQCALAYIHKRYVHSQCVLLVVTDFQR